jgi:hypothetical protein
VNFIPSPAYNIAKKIDKIIRREIFIEHNYSIRNSAELVQSIKDLPIKSSYTLASFDIVNLYTNVPVDETIHILEENLKKNSTLPEIAIDELINVTRTILKQNYFQFNGNFYLQQNGLSMGCPLSGILADIFLNHIENKHIFSTQNPYKDKIISYHRYVDDTLLIFNGNKRQLTILKNKLNKIHKNLQFTLEDEVNDSINFLDLRIKKSNSRLNFSIYRKPTTTDLTIHATSHHPYSHKIAAYNSFIHRLLSIPMSQTDFDEEVTTIKYIAVANGYKSSLIDQLIYKHKHKKPKNTTKDNSSYVSAVFGTALNHTITNQMAKNNVVVSFRTTNNLGSLLKEKQPKHNTNNREKAGVYKINCDDCQKFYIGQTTRSFGQRFKEHVPSRKSNLKSTFASHLVNNNHNYTGFEENMKILHFHNKKGRYLDCLEEFEIYRATK